MKKLVVIILILLIIFIGMYVYRQNKIHANRNSETTIDEVNKIETYLQKIYMWKEITGEALPTFDNINNAPEIWLWEVVKKNLEEYELSYEQIQEKAKELFGEELQKDFPKEGYQYMEYNEDTNTYYAIGSGLDNQEDVFLLQDIQKQENGYIVEIIEYLEDYSETESTDQTSATSIYLENLNEEKIVTIPSTTAEPDILENLKQNADKFPKKTLIIQEDEEGNLKVQKVIE